MDPEERKLRIHEIRVEILLHVVTDLAQTIKSSSRSTYPMLEDTRALCAGMVRERLDADRFLFDDSEETALERCRGSWPPVVSALAGDAGARSGLDEAAVLFKRHVLPLQRVAKTRGRYWAAWRAVCPWALSQGALGQILPMTHKAFHAFLLGRPVIPMYPPGDQALCPRHTSVSQAI
jgi:hypothetical protein